MMPPTPSDYVSEQTSAEELGEEMTAAATKKSGADSTSRKADQTEGRD